MHLSYQYILTHILIYINKGAFGNVYMATNNATKQKVALKRIPKKLASREDFQREMEALLRIQKWGGHPHIWLVLLFMLIFSCLSMHYHSC